MCWLIFKLVLSFSAVKNILITKVFSGLEKVTFIKKTNCPLSCITAEVKKEHLFGFYCWFWKHRLCHSLIISLFTCSSFFQITIDLWKLVHFYICLSHFSVAKCRIKYSLKNSDKELQYLETVFQRREHSAPLPHIYII